MLTLPQPERMTVSCFDRSGVMVYAEIVATQEADDKPWIWRAVFHDTGDPPAELMGMSSSLELVEDDMQARVAGLQVTGPTAAASALPVPGQSTYMCPCQQSPRASHRSTNLATLVVEMTPGEGEGLPLAARLLGIMRADLVALLKGAPMSDACAREIEWAAQKPVGWLDGVHEIEALF